MLRALVISLLVRLGMVLVTPIAAVAVFVLRISTRSQNQLFGFLFPLVIVTPVVLAAALFGWAWLAPRQAGKSYRGIPLAVAVMGLLIAALPLPFDRTPSLLTHGERVFGRVRVPVPVRAFTRSVRSFLDTCSEPDDCAPTRGGVPRRCAAATDGERMCVEITQGMGCCPTEAGCPEGWVCAWLTGPSRNDGTGVMDGYDSTDACVPARYTSRFREVRPAPSCKRRNFGDPVPGD